jgi:hypothetical protein
VLDGELVAFGESAKHDIPSVCERLHLIGNGITRTASPESGRNLNWRAHDRRKLATHDRDATVQRQTLGRYLPLAPAGHFVREAEVEAVVEFPPHG